MGGAGAHCGSAGDTLAAGAGARALIIIVCENVSLAAAALQHCHLTAPAVMTDGCFFFFFKLVSWAEAAGFPQAAASFKEQEQHETTDRGSCCRTQLELKL